MCISHWENGPVDPGTSQSPPKPSSWLTHAGVCPSVCLWCTLYRLVSLRHLVPACRACSPPCGTLLAPGRRSPQAARHWLDNPQTGRRYILFPLSCILIMFPGLQIDTIISWREERFDDGQNFRRSIIQPSQLLYKHVHLDPPT